MEDKRDELKESVSKFKSMVYQEAAAVTGGAVDVEFPDASPVGKLSIVNGPRRHEVTTINLVNLTRGPNPRPFEVRPRILISWSRPRSDQPGRIRFATDEELREAIHEALKIWLSPESKAA